MAHSGNIPAFLALFLGVWYIGAAIGELRQPGRWLKLADEIAASPLGQMLGGAGALAIGTLLVALVPPSTGDWLNLWLFAIGCIALIEGFAVLTMPERMTLFSRLIAARGARGIAILTLLLGVAFCLSGIIRI
ncbi:MAG: hypothetical protein ABL882_09090 [Sphingopyxis sp.]